MEITYETTINAPRERIWTMLNDFGNIQTFHPLVLESHSLSDIAGGMGATRRCDFGKGVAISERIVGLKEGESMDVDVYKREGMPGVVKTMTARFELSDGPGGTLVVGTLRIDIAPKIAAVFLGPVMKRQMTKAWRQLMAGMKRNAETGEQIDLKSPIDIDAVVQVA